MRMNDQTRVVIRNLIDDTFVFNMIVKLCTKHKSVSLLEGKVLDLLRETGIVKAEDDIDMNLVVKHFKEH